MPWFPMRFKPLERFPKRRAAVGFRRPAERAPRFCAEGIEQCWKTSRIANALPKGVVLASFPSVYEPIKIGNVEVKNRLIMAPMDTELTENYHLTEPIIDFYEQRAKGGVGLVEVGTCYVANLYNTKPQYYNSSGATGMWSDDFKEGWEELVSRCHKWGAKIAPQLNICYEWRASEDDPLEAVGPSDGPGGPFVKKLRELKPEEIETMIKQYGAAAKRAKDWGCDMIEIHAGIGYQVSRFISKFSNRRTDRWGGTDEKRCQFLIDIVNECRKNIGEDMPIIVRISVEDFMPGGNTMKESLPMMKYIEKNCHIDCWNVQVGFHEAPRPLVTQHVPEAAFAQLSQQVKQITKLPVTASYRINSIERCAQIIDDGWADMVTMARQFIADPETAIKGEEGHSERVRRCIACCRCLDNIFLGKPVQCSVNANVANYKLGTPPTYKDGIAQTDSPKNITIVGSGPSGMETARVAAMRGHKVTIIEHNKRIGGLMNMAQVLNPLIEPVRDWYENELNLLNNVTVKLSTEGTVDNIKATNPDEVVIAPGGNVPVPDCPGVDGKNVIASTDIKAMVEGKAVHGKGFMMRMAPIGVNMMNAKPSFMRWGLGTHLIVKKRLVIIGGGFAGIECAHSMMHGREITVVEEARKIGAEIGIIDKGPQLNDLRAAGVKLMPSTKVLEITKQGVRVYHNVADKKNVYKEGEDFIPCESVVLSLGVVNNTELYDQCKPVFGDKVRLIGNANPKPKTENPDEFRRLLEAVRDGYVTGMTI
mgnify:CR=1 FL=1